MFLRGLILNGFKTFARRTEIRFEKGVTAIVGPNGSGKTNIVDAFKWVLGESQARDLRGSRMDEVIYSGGLRRPRAGSAEVTLLIDNAEGRLPIDYSEVAISRRVDRGGHSEYVINGSRVRRRDILGLLQSTGLTVDSYALVDQSDIEAIVTCSPAQRRVLLEEAASIRGIKAKRFEAWARLQDLASNLVRLEDLRGEIEPRLEQARLQAGAAREAAAAQARLETLRGSIAWEEWREARDAHRRAETQLQSLQRRLDEASMAAELAERNFQQARSELQAAHNRQFAQQERLGQLRLALSNSEHEMAMAEERQRSQAALASAALAEDQDLASRAMAAQALADELEAELSSALARLQSVPAAPPPPPPPDPGSAREAGRRAESARRALAEAASALAAASTQGRLLQDSAGRLEEQVAAALGRLPAAEAAASAATAEARAAQEAGSELRRLEAELQGLEALRASPPAGMRRLGDVLVADPGYEAALSATLGALIDAWVAPDQVAAEAMVDPARPQTTLLYPDLSRPALAGSLLEHVRCDQAHARVAEALLGEVISGRPGPSSVSLDGVYRQPGLIRAGDDPRARLDARRYQLRDRARVVRPLAAEEALLGEQARRAETAVSDLRTQVAARHRLEELTQQLEAARRAEKSALERLPALEEASAEAGATAAALARDLDARQAAQADHRSEVRGLEVERLRWLERSGDLRRRLQGIHSEMSQIAQARAASARRAGLAAEQAIASEAALPALSQAVGVARRALEAAELEAPLQQAELAVSAHRLVSLEEARVDARLRASTLEGQAGLHAREAELALARMEEVRSRMPEGRAPEDVPGGRAREREMRLLERRLSEIGPTNPLAAGELAELEERSQSLKLQLDDITAAREDLKQLVSRLQAEESSRYDAVFGAVAANFREYFAELTGGGRATLRHVSGDEGPQSGVELLVQPPRKRLQNVTLLSSGERSLAALALVLGLEAVNPSPFTILDEVDAALDDANVERYTTLLQRLGRDRQFLVITHNHGTMAGAGALYGVHVDESGCSHLVSARLEDIREGSPAAREAAS